MNDTRRFVRPIMLLGVRLKKILNPDSILSEMTSQVRDTNFRKTLSGTHICHIQPCPRICFLKIHVPRGKNHLVD